MKRWILLGCLVVLVLLLSACDLFGPGGPLLLQLGPTSGCVRTSVVVVGAGFGDTQGSSTVTFEGIPAPVLSWSDSIITVEVPVIATPDGASAGVTVSVIVEGSAVGSGTFTVLRGILFESERSGNREIWLMNPNGSNPVNLTNHPVEEYWPCWSPDGTRIAYCREGQIYGMNADGSGQINLTNNPRGSGFPVWSPAGTAIVYQSDELSEIYVMDDDGAGQTNLTHNPGLDAWPSWSPDGSKIVFHADRELVIGDMATYSDNPDVYVMNADGTGETCLTSHPGRDWLAVWSPGGTKIAFQSDRDGAGEIYAMNPDGSGQVNLTSNPGADGWPAWSPDGTKIAFQSYRDGNAEIYVTNAEGSGVARLTSNAATDSGPSWSPDGTKIVFESDRDGNLEVYVMNADGTEQTRLTDASAFDGFPVWTESRWIPLRP